jgi:hypothetical protein
MINFVKIIALRAYEAIGAEHARAALAGAAFIADFRLFESITTERVSEAKHFEYSDIGLFTLQKPRSGAGLLHVLHSELHCANRAVV